MMSKGWVMRRLNCYDSDAPSMVYNMTANSNSAHPGVARYRLGIGLMPPDSGPLCPQDITLTQIQRALDEGAFKQT